MWLAYCLSGSPASMRRNSVPSCDLYSFRIYPFLFPALILLASICPGDGF